MEAMNVPQMPIIYKKAELVIKHHLYTKTLTLINIYVSTKIPFYTFQHMARTSNHYEKRVMWG